MIHPKYQAFGFLPEPPKKHLPGIPWAPGSSPPKDMFLQELSRLFWLKRLELHLS